MTASPLWSYNNKMSSVTDVVKHLKETLSQILTRFYPLAGEVKDNFHIECNDKGVNFMVARANQNLKEFLHDPHDEKVRELFPESPTSADSSIGNYLIGVQVSLIINVEYHTNHALIYALFHISL